MPLANDQFYDIVGAVLQECLETLKTKGHDYAALDNRLRNFEEDARDLNLPTWAIIRIFAQKHEKAIKVFRETGSVESEPPEMRYVDRINYLLLDLADAIANGGYEPRTEWLKKALSDDDTKEPLRFPLRDPVISAGMKAHADERAESADERITGQVTKPLKQDPNAPGRAGVVCCNPEGEDCCVE